METRGAQRKGAKNSEAVVVGAIKKENKNTQDGFKPPVLLSFLHPHQLSEHSRKRQTSVFVVVVFGRFAKASMEGTGAQKHAASL